MFLIQVCFKSTLKQNLFTLKEYKQLFSLSPEIQDSGQKEIMRGKLKFWFSKWKLPFYPCYHAFLWCLLVKDFNLKILKYVTCFGCSPRVNHKPKFSALSWWTTQKAFVTCHCFHAPIKTFFFDACQMTVRSCVLHLFPVPQTGRSAVRTENSANRRYSFAQTLF